MFLKIRIPLKLLFLFLLFFGNSSFSQSNALDSLLVKISKEKTDTNNIKYYYRMVQLLSRIGEYNRALLYSDTVIAYCKKLNNKYILSNVFNEIGIIYLNRGDLTVSLKYFTKSLNLRIELGDPKEISNSNINIGIIYENQGEYVQALKYYFKSLKIKEEVKDRKGEATCLNNIGIIYKNQGNFSKSLEFYFKSLDIYNKEHLENVEMANTLNNIGVIFEIQQKHDDAKTYYMESFNLRKKLGDKRGIVISMLSMGELDILLYEQDKVNYEKNSYPGRNMDSYGLLDSAIDLFEKALIIGKELNDEYFLGYTYNVLAHANLIKKKYDEGLKYFKKSLYYTGKTGAKPEEMQANKSIAECYFKNGDFKNAYIHLQNAFYLRDSIFNNEKNKDIGRIEAKYEFEKLQFQKEQNEKERLRIEAESRERRDHLQYSLIVLGMVGLIITILFLGKMNINPKLAEIMIFMVFLIFFEFILVLIDPYVEFFTGGAPGLKLLINAIIAALIFPFHAVCERWVRRRILKEGGVKG
ncbi:MAG: hypothetical protein A3G23_02790 [Bacteroidetes bacterium RIFCSPLOWO2_12_FULL_37_12]|nr:MAG: hypothetical protein A3G23_02790 [Bacteroidetes bacterium RIFCSPLOWO2_12_FULL_37_12]